MVNVLIIGLISWLSCCSLGNGLLVAPAAILPRTLYPELFPKSTPVHSTVILSFCSGTVSVYLKGRVNVEVPPAGIG